MSSFCCRIIFDVCIWYVELHVLCIHVIYLQYFKQSADTFKHISVDMNHDDQVILVIKNIVFFYEILFYLSIRCPLILTKKLKAHMSTVDGKQYVINTHEAVCHTLLKKKPLLSFSVWNLLCHYTLKHHYWNKELFAVF